MYDLLNQTNVTPVGKEKWSKHFVITEKQWVSIFYLPFTFDFLPLREVVIHHKLRKQAWLVSMEKQINFKKPWRSTIYQHIYILKPICDALPFIKKVSLPHVPRLQIISSGFRLLKQIEPVHLNTFILCFW